MDELRAMIERVLSGDDRAFGVLVDRYQNMAVAYGVSLLGDFHLAQDAAQEAFLAAYRDLPTLAEPAAFPGWFRKIVFKYCDRVRRRRPLPTVPLDNAPNLPDVGGDPAVIHADTLSRAERDATVTAALLSLAEADRSVLTLFYMGEHSVEEIGVFLQISQDAVKKRLQRARERLKERMLTMVGQSLTENAPSRSLRFTEAASLMRRATSMLEADDRVVAAWLADSFGVAGDTGWTSAWLQVIVKDDTIDDFILNSVEHASRIGEPLLCGIGPQNAPRGGAYCQAVYGGEAGPYEINWYWQPRTGATIPTGTVIPSEEARPVTHILLNRGGIPESGDVLRCEYNWDWPDVLRRKLDARTDAERDADNLRNTIQQFWFMLLISARWIAGAPEEAAPRHVDHILGLLTSTQEALGRPNALPDTNRAYTGAAFKLALLREAASTMESLLPDADKTGARVNPSIVPAARRFMDMIEAA